MSKANQKARVSFASQGVFNNLKQVVIERRQARELNHSRDKQATQIYRHAKSVFYYGV